MVATRINYDMLNYLPDDMDTVIGQDELMEDFGKGAFSMIWYEDMPEKDVAELKTKSRGGARGHGALVHSLADMSVPMELLPDKIYNEFNTDDSTHDGRVLRQRHLRGRDHGRHPRDPRHLPASSASLRACPRW